jgi:diaminopimelate epimerase
MFDMIFTKMHGLGNDFVVLDARDIAVSLNSKQINNIADRRQGIGCDQILIIEKSKEESVDVFMRIFNSDGIEVDACGNGTRCVASLMMTELDVKSIAIQTNAGVLYGMSGDDGNIAVDIGPANLGWKDIPLAYEVDTLTLDFSIGVLSNPVMVNIGNPHAVFFVDDVESIHLETLGPEIETHKMFPERTNVNVAQILSNGSIRLRVWERGVGITNACGTGACATLVAASRRNLTSRSSDVILDGGTLSIEWRDNNHVIMTGPVATVFTGVIHKSILR